MKAKDVKAMTVDECLTVLNHFRGWNVEQESISVTSGGVRNADAQKIFDEMRRTILAVTKRLGDIASIEPLEDK